MYHDSHGQPYEVWDTPTCNHQSPAFVPPVHPQPVRVCIVRQSPSSGGRGRESRDARPIHQADRYQRDDSGAIACRLPLRGFVVLPVIERAVDMDFQTYGANVEAIHCSRMAVLAPVVPAPRRDRAIPTGPAVFPRRPVRRRRRRRRGGTRRHAPGGRATRRRIIRQVRGRW